MEHVEFEYLVLMSKPWGEVRWARRLRSTLRPTAVRWLMDELESDRRWSRSFETSPDQLAVLAQEAIEEDLAGRTEPLDPERP